MRRLLGLCLWISACEPADPCEPTPRCADDSDCAAHELCAFQRVACECEAYHGECGQALCQTRHDWYEDFTPPLALGDETQVLRAEVANPHVLACGVVMVRLQHRRPSEVALRLRGPRGEELSFRGTESRVVLPNAWEGGVFDGVWTLEVRDEVEGESGVLHGWTLRLFDTEAAPAACALVGEP